MDKEICVRADMGESQTIKTMIHEVAPVSYTHLLVQKIEVSADKRIRIVFGFRDVFTELGKESAET